MITEDLLILHGQEKHEHMESPALDYAISKCCHGLSPLYYSSIPHVPSYAASGNVVHVHLPLAEEWASKHMLMVAL